ncbi:uncharacterized protein LOC142774411 [Rhipicephalus microplus]|uniref:uncharacterized protein LOC142774411 n=1 Tax=Rhipicephalus microplus TaxID=6941 RepID=UPI003F6D9AEA
MDMADEEMLHFTFDSGSYSQTYQASACQDNASSDADWTDILKDLYKITFGYPPSPQLSDVADEELPRYSTLHSGSYKVVQDKHQADTSQDNVSDAPGSTQREQCKCGAHSEFNHGEKPPRERGLTCEICARSFARYGYLVQHRRIHTGEKPYHCDACGKLFARQYDFARHRRTHSGEKSHRCATCSKSFAESATLRKHERTHKDKKPPRCKVWRHLIVTWPSLKRHRHLHGD